MRQSKGADARPPQPATGADMRALYEEHGSALLTYLMGLTRGDRHRAEDILQETLVRAWRHPEARSAAGGWSRAWLYTVARNIVIDHTRAAMARPSEIFDDRIDNRARTGDPIEALVDRNLLTEAIASLPERFRTVLVEIYFWDRTLADTAKLLGVPIGTVKSRTFYALAALREELLKRGVIRSSPDE